MDINLLRTFLPTSSVAGSTKPQAGSDQIGGLLVSEFGPRYSALTYARASFNCGNQGPTGATTTVGLAATYTGLILSNAPGNTVNVHVGKVGYAFNVAFPAAAYIGLMTGYNAGTAVTHSAAVTPRSNFFGVGASPQALVDSSAVMPTAPFLTHVFGWAGTGAVTVPLTLNTTVIDLEGSLILPPGAYCAIYTSTVSGTNGLMASFQWFELPI